MKRFLKFTLIILLIFPAGRITAQVKFSASVEPARIAKDELTQLKLAVENGADIQKILPPLLNDFVVVSGPNQESGMTMINGNVKKIVALSYLLKPRKPGKFTLKPATAVVDGTTYHSAPVTVEVSNAVSGTGNSNAGNNMPAFGFNDPFADMPVREEYNDYILKKGENPADKIKQNLFVRLETNKTSCYVGEPVIATYKLYTRLKSESNMTKTPSFNGFSVIDLITPDNNELHQEKLNGREYNTYTLRKVQLYPLQSGSLVLESGEIDNTVHFIKAEYANQQQEMMNDIFRDFADATIPAEGIIDEKVTLQSNPVTIQVKALPDVGKPADFKGAVGNFTISAALEKNNFSTDDAGKLRVTISGEGNLQLVTAPEINWPAGTEAFDPKVTDDLYKTTVPVSGTKMIDFPFTVDTPGTYTIPAVHFSYFDPNAGKYKALTTEPLRVTVTKGTGKGRQPVVDNAANPNNSALNRFFSNRLRVVSVVAALIIIGLIVWLKLDRKKEKRVVSATEIQPEGNEALSPELEEKLAVPLNPLAEAETALQSGDAVFYQILNDSIKKYLSGFLHIPAGELNKKSIIEQLDKRNISNSVCLELQELLDEIEWQLYTPLADLEKQQVHYNKAHELLQLLNTYRG